MANFRQARQALVQGILEGNGTESHAQRRAAFDNAELEEPLHFGKDSILTMPYRTERTDHIGYNRLNGK